MSSKKTRCKHCESLNTDLYAVIKDGINNKYQEVFLCYDCDKRTTITR